MATGVIWDMHTHLACLTNEKYIDAAYEVQKKHAYDELKYRRSQNIAAFFSCGTPQEWEFMQAVIQEWKKEQAEYMSEDLQMKPEKKRTLLSFGIHPWYSEQYESDEYREYFKQCDAVGEIGMDSVWCDVPLLQQKMVFEAQLQTAADLGKPIILHTKGQEREIADMIRDFPQKICVHWYSGDMDALEIFLQKDCYFTLGPDLTWNVGSEVYQFLLKYAPEDRLFLETDGLDAVIWAYEQIKKKDVDRGFGINKEEAWSMLGDVIHCNLDFLAAGKKKSLEEMQRQLQRNLSEFLHR